MPLGVLGWFSYQALSTPIIESLKGACNRSETSLKTASQLIRRANPSDGGCDLRGIVEILFVEVLADEKALFALVLQTVEEPS